MAGLDDIVVVRITSQTSPVLQKGFGIPLILSALAPWPDRVRTYKSDAAVLEDGFAPTSPEYLAARAFFSQSPRGAELKIGRIANKPTMRWRLTPVVLKSEKFAVKVNGTEVFFVSDGTATAAKITAGLKVAIDALALPLTVTDNGAADGTLAVVANVPGAWHSLEVVNVARLGIAQDHADPGVVADLAAIALENGDWYAVINPWASQAMHTAIAEWVEANERLFFAASQDSAIITTAAAGATDFAGTSKVAALARTVVIYHPNPRQFADAAWAGKGLPYDPGSITWKFKTLAGVSSTTLTGTHTSNAEAKNANHYQTVGGKNITAQGVVAAGEFIDTVHGRDWLKARIQEDVFDVLSSGKKVALTDAGITTIVGAVDARLSNGIAVGFLSDNPPPKVSAPKVAEVPKADRANRHLPDVTFEAVIAGAIHKLTINGTITV